MTRPKPQRALPDPLLSINETADYWGTSTDTVEQKIKTGELPAVRLGPRLVRIRLRDAEALLEPVQARPDDVVA